MAKRTPIDPFEDLLIKLAKARNKTRASVYALSRTVRTSEEQFDVRIPKLASELGEQYRASLRPLT